MKHLVHDIACPVLDRAHVNLANRLYHLSGRLRFEVAGRSYALLFPNQAVRTRVLGMDLQVGAETCYLDFQRYPFVQEVREFLDGGSLSNLEPFLTQAVLENLLADLLKHLSLLWLAEVNIQAVHLVDVPRRYKRTVTIAVEGGEHRGRVLGGLSASDHLLDQLVNSLSEVPATCSPAWDFLSIPVRPLLGRTELPYREYLDLEPGDVVLLDETLSFEDTGVMTLALPAGRVVRGRFQYPSYTVEELQMNTEEMKQDVLDWDSLPVNLGFELGEHQMELGLLSRVQPGYVFDLHTGFEKPVTIRANGRVIGRGDIVRVDDRLAVRVVDLKLPHSGDSAQPVSAEPALSAQRGAGIDPDALAVDNSDQVLEVF